MSKISRFTREAVTLAKNAVGGRDEVAAPEGVGGFADYALVSLHCLRIYLDESYRNALDLLSEISHILASQSGWEVPTVYSWILLKRADPSHY